MLFTDDEFICSLPCYLACSGFVSLSRIRYFGRDNMIREICGPQPNEMLSLTLYAGCLVINKYGLVLVLRLLQQLIGDISLNYIMNRRC